MKEVTLAIIKPDAVRSGYYVPIFTVIRANKLTVIKELNCTLSRMVAEMFYGEHRGKPFYEELIKLMTSGPLTLLVLEGNEVIKKWRELIGDTDPSKAQAGTLRQLYGKNKGENAVHGSDSVDSAMREIGLFFPELLRHLCQD